MSAKSTMEDVDSAVLTCQDHIDVSAMMLISSVLMDIPEIRIPTSVTPTYLRYYHAEKPLG